MAITSVCHFFKSYFGVYYVVKIHARKVCQKISIDVILAVY